MTVLSTEPAAGHWHPVARSADLVPRQQVRTVLLEQTLVAWREQDGSLRGTMQPAYAPRLRDAYGLVWANPLAAGNELPEFPEFAESRYQHVLCGPYGVRTSAPRIIENFLDMGHFPFVHEGILGQRPRTEVLDYKVDEAQPGHGPVATECAFWQPGTRVLEHGGASVFYTYRVPRPYCAILTKQPDAEGGQGVAILLAVQPAQQARSIAWMVFSTTNRLPTEKSLRAHQERVFMQDKPILENQLPARLPLDPRAEMPVPCDRLATAYRRYLQRLGIGFGVIAA